MKQKRKKFAPILVATSVVGIVCALQLLPDGGFGSGKAAPGLIQRLQWIGYDVRVRLAAAFPDSAPVSPKIGAVVIDDMALQSMNTGGIGENLMWPWPRFVHGMVVRELSAQGAEGIGFDILFPEDFEWRPLPGGWVAEMLREVSSDEFFAREIETSGRVYLATQAGMVPTEPLRASAADLGSIDSAPDLGVLRRAAPFTEYRLWHPHIRYLAKVFDLDLSRPDFTTNSVSFPSVQDGPFAFDLNDSGDLILDEADQEEAGVPPKPFFMKRAWNLGIVLAAKSLGIELDDAEVSEDRVVLRGDNGVERVIPLDADGKFYIDWTISLESLKSTNSPATMETIHNLLVWDQKRQSGEPVPSAMTTEGSYVFNDKIVVIGSMATGNNLTDVGATPLKEEEMLMTKHLNIANSILTGRFIRPYPKWMELMMVVIMGGIATLLTWNTRVIGAAIGVVLVAAVYFALGAYLFVEHRLWLPLVVPLLGGLALPHFSMVLYWLVFEQREQRHIKGVFTKIVSPDVVDELLEAEKLSLGGARREISVLFADVRGFTEFTDNNQANAEAHVERMKLDPEAAERYFNQQAAEALQTVNLYLSISADMIKRHGGTLDKYIGDCVMAFWGAPVANPRHAACCVRAAIDAQRAIYKLNQERQAENQRREQINERNMFSNEPLLPLFPLLTLGSGINTGMVTVGLMGSEAHIFNYTVFGREVNLASRLEAVSGRGRIIISEATHKALVETDPDLAKTCVALPSVTVKGIRQAVEIYEAPWLTAEEREAAARLQMQDEAATRIETVAERESRGAY